MPDDTIFDDVIFDYKVLRTRLREMAFLTKGLKINLEDKREGKEQRESFHYEGGIKEFIAYLNKTKTALYDKIIYIEGNKDDIYVEVAMQHNDSYNELTLSFVNNINTPEGGMHLTGFKSAITKVFNDYARSNKILRDKEENLSGDDLREGLTAIVSIKIPEPQFEGQTKQKLGNAEARTAVEGLVTETFTYFLRQKSSGGKGYHPGKAVVAQRARMAARKDVAVKVHQDEHGASR